MEYNGNNSKLVKLNTYIDLNFLRCGPKKVGYFHKQFKFYLSV